MTDRAWRMVFGVMLAALASLAAAASPVVQWEDLTSTELRNRIAAGTDTVLLPIGGTEQNGPHMVLGKHNVRARILAERIAQRLGHAVVAPVLAYVPEGAIEPPTQHMRYAGTISITPAAFEAVLEGAARSFKLHGFRNIFFLGDHGGYQSNLEHVAAKLNREWSAQPVRVHALSEYYRVTQSAYVEALKAKGFRADEIGTHAGLADTSLALAVDPSLVHMDLAASRAPGAKDGVAGDPRRSSAELGRLGTDRIVDASVAAIAAQLRQADRKEKP